MSPETLLGGVKPECEPESDVGIEGMDERPCPRSSARRSAILSALFLCS